MKVAYYSPLPPDTSGIADYSTLLLPALERLVEVEVVRPGRTRPVGGVDVSLYHIGNNPDAHGWIVDALRRRPGVVVLHDWVIHHLVAGLTIGRKDGHAYLAAMEREAGVPGRLLGYGVLEGRVPPLWEVRPEEFPLAGEVLDRATGLIVHSHYVEEKAREHGYDGPLWRISHPAWPPPGVEPAAVDGAPLIGCFGHINESKRIPQLLRAFAELRRAHPGARLLLVGLEAPGFDLAGRLERTGLDSEGVIREPYVEERRLWSLMAACDACVLLRAPTMGETSGSAIRTLSLGKPVVVSDVGWFAELPDEVALKVPVGGDEEIAALAAALERLADPEVVARMGDAARAYVEREHDLDRVAGLYAAALEEAAGDAAVREGVLREVAEAAAGVGLEPELLAPELRQAALVSPDGRGPAGHVQVPGTGTRLLRAWPMWLWVASLYAVSVVVQLTLGLRVVSPWIMVDELVYSDMARSFAAHGHFFVRGATGSYGFVYPLLLAPEYALLGSMHDVYQWARVVDALVMSSAVVPAYLLARRVVRPPSALAAAALAVALPSMAYVGTLMTENAFYPIFLWLAFALLLMLERPTLARQVAVLALCVLAFVTRAQTVALVAAVLTAPLVLAWIERGRPRRLGAFKALYGIAAAGVALVVVVELARGRSPSHVLGNYSKTSSGGYHLWPALKWLVLHVAELDLYVWILPFAALIVLVANARHLDRPLRVFAAATASLSVWLVLEVAVFASRYSLRIEERNLFYLAPLLLVALLAWIERGQPRPPRAAVAAAGVAAALPGAIPFLHLLNITAESDTLGFQPWWYLGGAWAGLSSVSIAVVLVSIALGAAFIWLPRRWAPIMPVLVALGFLATWIPLEQWKHGFPQLSKSALAQGIGRTNKSWIDSAVGRNAHVAVLWSGGNDLAVWENEFWNRSVDRVYNLGDSPPGRHADDPRLGRPPDGDPARPSGPPDSGAVRADHERGEARRDAGRPRSHEAARALPRLRTRARDDAHRRPVPGDVPPVVRPEADVDALLVHRRHARRHRRERRAPVQGQNADGARDRDDAAADPARALEHVGPLLPVPAHAEAGRLHGLVCDLARPPAVRLSEAPPERPAPARAALGHDPVHTAEVRIVADVSPLSHVRTGVGNYVRGSLLGIIEASAGEDEVVAFAPASARGRREIESALDGVDLRRRLPVVPLGAHALRTAWSRLGSPPLERFVGPLDVFHFSDWMYPPQRGGIRSTMVHDLVPLHHPEWVHPRTRTMHGAKYRHTAEACDVVIVNSRFTGDDVTETLGVDPAKIHVAYPGVEAGFSPEGERLDLEGRSYALTVATLEPRKNLSSLVAAYRQLDRDELSLLVVGAAGWGDQPELDVPGIVRLGYTPREELARLYRGASVFVYPSLFEGFGMPVVEAMACGVPCVVSSHPSLDEACGDAAVRADPNDPAAIGAAIERALAEHDDLAARGLEHARRFTWLENGRAHLAAWRAAA